MGNLHSQQQHILSFYTLFRMFDDVMLLAKGGLICYQGSVKKVEDGLPSFWLDGCFIIGIKFLWTSLKAEVMASSASTDNSTHGGSAHGSFLGDDESALTQSDGEWVQHQALSSFPDTNRFIHHLRI
ncbi:hypothetical protein YC2023_014714 [Brassica napus]